jgi:hypothetical protein
MANQQIANIFQVLKSKRGSARPNTGQGFLGQWPEDGEHVCIVDTIEIVSEEKTKFTFMRNEQRVEVPATRIRFWYTLTEDPNSPTEPLRWGGQPFTFPNDPSCLNEDNENEKKRMNVIAMDRDRLSGHLTTILGTEVGTESGLDIGEALDSASALVNDDDSMVIADVKVETRTFKKRDGSQGEQKNEYVTKLAQAG